MGKNKMIMAIIVTIFLASIVYSDKYVDIKQKNFSLIKNIDLPFVNLQASLQGTSNISCSGNCTSYDDSWINATFYDKAYIDSLNISSMNTSMFVPYINATDNVDLGSYNFSASNIKAGNVSDYISFGTLDTFLGAVPVIKTIATFGFGNTTIFENAFVVLGGLEHTGGDGTLNANLVFADFRGGNGGVFYDYDTNRLVLNPDVYVQGSLNASTGYFDDLTSYNISDNYLKLYGELDWTGGNIQYIPCDADIKSTLENAGYGQVFILGSCTYDSNTTIQIHNSMSVIGAQLTGIGRGGTFIGQLNPSANHINPVINISSSGVTFQNLMIFSLNGTAVTIQPPSDADGNLYDIYFKNAQVISYAYPLFTGFDPINAIGIDATNVEFEVDDSVVLAFQTSDGYNATGLRLRLTDQDDPNFPDSKLNLRESAIQSGVTDPEGGTIAGISRGLEVLNENTYYYSIIVNALSTSFSCQGSADRCYGLYTEGISNQIGLQYGTVYGLNESYDHSVSAFGTLIVGSVFRGTPYGAITVYDGDYLVNTNFYANTANVTNGLSVGGNTTLYSDLIASTVSPSNGVLSVNGNITADNICYTNGTGCPSGGNASWNEGYARDIFATNDSAVIFVNNSLGNFSANQSSIWQYITSINNLSNASIISLAGSGSGGNGWVNTSNITYTNLSVGIGTSDPIGELDVANGLVNNTYNVSVVNIEGYFSNPFFSFGYFENKLLQSESFATTWTRNNLSGITANSAISPDGTLIAENIYGNGSVSNASIQQSITNSTLGNFTFSVYLRSYQNNNSFPTININLMSDTENGFGKNITLSPAWKRYFITFNFATAHTTKTVMIMNGINNISAWGAQLEIGNYARPLSPASTTSGYNLQGVVYSRLPFTTTGAITSGAGISGTTGGFSGAITDTQSLAFISTNGLVLQTTATPTGNAPIRLAPRLLFSGNSWETNTSTGKSVNFKEEEEVISGNTSRANLVFDYGYNSVTNTNFSRLMNLQSTGALDVLGNDYGSQVLANPNFVGNASWNASGGWVINTTLNMTQYRFALAATGNLTQNTTAYLTPVNPNRWYKFNYNVSGTGVAGCTAYINPVFSTEKVYLPGVSLTTANQLYMVYAKTNSNPGNFTITANCTAGSFYLGNMTLVEVQSGNIVANGLFTGGGTIGIKIDGVGNTTVGGMLNSTGQITANKANNSLMLPNLMKIDGVTPCANGDTVKWETGGRIYCG